MEKNNQCYLKNTTLSNIPDHDMNFLSVGHFPNH